MEFKFNLIVILYFRRRSTMELSEVTGDVNLVDLDSEVLPWLVIDLFLKDRDFFGVVEEHPRSHSVC